MCFNGLALPIVTNLSGGFSLEILGIRVAPRTRGDLFMHFANDPSVSVFEFRLRHLRVVLATAFILLLPVITQGQTSPEKARDSTKQSDWHQYVNREYGFSFWYPNTYRPLRTSPPSDEEKESWPYDRGLLLLRPFDDPDAAIWINIDVRPFNLQAIAQEFAPRGSEPSTRQPLPKGHQIGNHMFYYYGGFTGGTGNYPDTYLVKVNGKTLQIQFDGPYTYGLDIPTDEIKHLEPKILKTLRTF
jgi:hypothetical protein